MQNTLLECSNTSTSFTEKSEECDKHPLLKVSEFELEPVKLQREMQKRKVNCAEINNDLYTSRGWCEILQVRIKIKCKMTSSPQSHIVSGAHRKIVICTCSKFFTFRLDKGSLLKTRLLHQDDTTGLHITSNLCIIKITQPKIF
jgi:hypothetical protein